MKSGFSYTKGNYRDYGKYEVVRLPDGKNTFTGSTNVHGFFTCVELEVFALEHSLYRRSAGYSSPSRPDRKWHCP